MRHQMEWNIEHNMVVVTFLSLAQFGKCEREEDINLNRGAKEMQKENNDRSQDACALDAVDIAADVVAAAAAALFPLTTFKPATKQRVQS